MIKVEVVKVVGARGRMGREVIRAVSKAPDLYVAAEVDLGDDRDARPDNASPRARQAAT
jgi:dihydrodipicolinate reductase